VRARPHLFVFRNSFTRGASGGDVHTAAVHRWMHQQPTGFDVVVVAPGNDGQDEAYPTLRDVGRVRYPAPSFAAAKEMSTASVLRIYASRAVACVLLAKLPRSGPRDLFVSSTHFIPDVFPAAAMSLLTPKSTRAAYVFHLIGDVDRAPGLRTWLAGRQEAVCLEIIRRWFEKIFVINEHTRLRLIELGFQPARVHLTRCVVDVPSDVASRPLADKDLSIVFCGRLVKQKGVFDFLKVCERLQREDPKFSAVMIGSGPEQPAIEREIRARNLRVRLTGFVSEHEKANLVASARLFVFPSYEEGWGIVISEAFALGTPVLAYGLDIYREIFGSLVQVSPLGDPAALAERASTILAGYARDPALYAREQAADLAFARELSPQRIATGELAFLLLEE
jgi:glycosyltransferase involved in cell wall biosynthesis